MRDPLSVRAFSRRRKIMNRRTTYTLTAASLLALAIAALSQVAFAQSVNPNGIFQLNLAKSKFSPGPPPKSQTVYFQWEGQNPRDTVVGIDAAGNPVSAVFMEVIPDGKPHPVTGNPNIDASTYTRVDAYTMNFSRFKDGKPGTTGTLALSQDGKTFTATTTGTDANGQQINNIAVYDKQ
jgi:hypothetical protein